MIEGDGLGASEAWPGAHKSAGWLAADGQWSVRGHAQRPFALASVTKLLTATAVLVATQEEIVSLDEPAGPAGSTVRHLLAHASGLSFEGRDPVAPPGRRRIYGNAGFDALADLVAQRAGLPFASYAAEAVTAPLAMVDTRFGTSAAHGASSTGRDLLRFAGELLRPGSVLAPETLIEATTPQFPDLGGILPGFGRQDPNPWGLGFELRDAKSPHWMPSESSPATFGHFGQSGAFLWVDPEADLACFGLCDKPFGPWAVSAWPALGAAVLAAAGA